MEIVTKPLSLLAMYRPALNRLLPVAPSKLSSTRRAAYLPYLARRAFSGGTASSASAPPPPPAKKVDRLSLGTFRNQLLLTALSCGVMVLGGQNYGMSQELDRLKAKEGGSSEVAYSLTVEDVSCVAKEVAHLTCQSVMELQSASFLGGGSLDKKGIERLEERVRELVPETLKKVRARARRRTARWETILLRARMIILPPPPPRS